MNNIVNQTPSTIHQKNIRIPLMANGKVIRLNDMLPLPSSFKLDQTSPNVDTNFKPLVSVEDDPNIDSKASSTVPIRVQTTAQSMIQSSDELKMKQLVIQRAKGPTANSTSKVETIVQSQDNKRRPCAKSKTLMHMNTTQQTQSNIKTASGITKPLRQTSVNSNLNFNLQPCFEGDELSKGKKLSFN